MEWTIGVERRESFLVFHNDLENGFYLSTRKHNIMLRGKGYREFRIYMNSRNNLYVQMGK